MRNRLDLEPSRLSEKFPPVLLNPRSPEAAAVRHCLAPAYGPGPLGQAMDWLAWAPTMAAIRQEFGYDAEPDREAAHLLLKLVPPTNRFRDLGVEVRNRRDVVIAGCGPGLPKAKADLFVGKAVVAADGATERLRELGIVPRLVVSDLDGKPEALEWAAAQGSRMVVHAHGDNRKAIGDLVPRLGPQVY